MYIPEYRATDIPSKDELLQRLAATDPVVYGCMTAQRNYDLSDDEMYRLMIMMLADRYTHISRAYHNLIAQLPPSPFISIPV